MSLYQDIRGALQTALGAVAGIPSIAYEGVDFEPTPGTAFVECVLVPTEGRPVTMGSGHLIHHRGTFQITCVYPAGKGTGAAEVMADAIKAAFQVSQVLTQNSVDVRLTYAERGAAIIETPWVRVPISVGWYLHSTDY